MPGAPRGQPVDEASASRRWRSCACGGLPDPERPWVWMVREGALPSTFHDLLFELGVWRLSVVEGLMQDYELSLQHVLWRVERLHQKKEVVTKREHGVHRMTNGELVPRIYRLAGALKRLGIKPGDRVPTLAFNNHRHLELYYAVPCMCAVLHTRGPRYRSAWPRPGATSQAPPATRKGLSTPTARSTSTRWACSRPTAWPSPRRTPCSRSSRCSTPTAGACRTRAGWPDPRSCSPIASWATRSRSSTSPSRRARRSWRASRRSGSTPLPPLRRHATACPRSPR